MVLSEHCNVAMHEIEEHWDDMQFYAFVDQVIAKNEREKRERETEQKKAEWRKQMR